MSQAHLPRYGVNVRPFIDARVPHFHVCNGRRPGGPFLQFEAWEVRETIVDHVARVAKEESMDQ